MVCTGNQEVGDVGPCIGDAGGPLVVPDSSDADLAVLYGLVSWGGNPCAQADRPEVYTRITPLVGFIRGHMKGIILTIITCFILIGSFQVLQHWQQPVFFFKKRGGNNQMLPVLEHSKRA